MVTRPSWPARCGVTTATGAAERKVLTLEGGEAAGGAGWLDAQHESPTLTSPGCAYFVSFFGMGGGEPSNSSPPVTCLTLAAG